MANNLESLSAMLAEVEEHAARLAKEARAVTTGKTQASAAVIQQELGETVMPLFRDVATKLFAELVAVRQYLHQEVEPLLAEAIGEVSTLVPEDAELITLRLTSYKTLLEQMQLQTDLDAGRKAQIQGELDETDKALALVAEITMEEDDDDDPDDAEVDDDDPDDDDDEDDDEDAAQVAPAKQ